jgi:O-antigen/teichoic acid export membrane protein
MTRRVVRDLRGVGGPQGQGTRSGGPRAVDDLLTVARGGATNVLGIGANGILQFLLVVVISRGMGPEGAGVFFQAIALFMIVTAAAQFGSDAGVIRMLHVYPADGRDADRRRMLSVALWTVFLLSGLLATGMFLAAPLIADAFMRGVSTSTSVLLIRILAPFIPLATITLVTLAATRAFGTMIPTVAVENIGKPAARLALVLVAMATGAGIVAVMLSWAAPVAVGAVLALFVLREMARRRGIRHMGERSPGKRRLAAEFWRFAAPRGAAGIVEITLGWLDILLLGAFRPAAEVGVYAAVSRAAVAALFILRATNKAFQPRISALLAGDRRDEAQTLYQVATCWLMAASLPIFITLAVFPDFLLGVFGEGFDAGRTPLLILALAMLVNVSTGNVNAVLVMGGRGVWNLLNSSAALAINIVLNLLLIPRIGIVGAAVAWAISIIVTNLAAVVQVRVFLGLRPFGKGFLTVVGTSALCFGALGVVIRTMMGSSAGSFILFAILSVSLYGVALFRNREPLHLPLLRAAISPGRKVVRAAG